MPNQPATPVRNIRVPAPLWKAALARAHDENRTLTAVIREFLESYVARTRT